MQAAEEAAARGEPFVLDPPSSVLGGVGGDSGSGGDLANRGPGSDPTDVLNYNLDLDVNPSTRLLTGSCTMTIRSQTASLSSFVFRLRSQYTITAAVVTDSQGSYNVTPTGPPASSYARTVTLARPVPLNQTFTLRIDYTGTAVTVQGSINFGTQGGNQLVYTLSQPYYAGTWWPCKDGDVFLPGDNSDKATITFAITVPNGLRAVSNGLLASTSPVGTTKTKYTWVSTTPLASYLLCFAATVYNTWTVMYNYPGGSMPVEFNLYPASDTSGNRTAAELSVQMLEAYRPVFGLYPFINEKYGIYQFGFPGGMEHQTNSGQNSFGASLTAHELTHQWWGDSITCRTWNDIWLNEGFATYGEAIWEERKPGSTGLPALHSAMNVRRPADVNGTVWNPDTTSLSRIFSNDFSYRKGAWVVHMLRKVLGDARFITLLADYRAAFTNGAPDTEDFIAAASGAAGSDLSWFFDPWVYQPGAPAYEFSWQAVTIGGQAYLRARVRQTQTAYPLFTMPLDLKITSATNTTTVTLWNNAADEYFLVPLASGFGTPTSAAFDEFNWILSTSRSTTAGVTGAPPKVLSVEPAPGALLGPFPPGGGGGDGVSQVRAVFSDNVTLPGVPGSGASLTRNGQAVSINAAYDGTQRALTISPAAGGAFVPGSYQLTIDDAVNVGGTLLDGEYPGSWAFQLNPTISVPTFPSGDGTAGGDAVFTFVIQACPADTDANGTVDPVDLFAFLDAWFAQSGGSPPVPPAPSADFDDDQTVTPADLFGFLDAWFAGCG